MHIRWGGRTGEVARALARGVCETRIIICVIIIISCIMIVIIIIIVVV